MDENLLHIPGKHCVKIFNMPGIIFILVTPPPFPPRFDNVQIKAKFY